MNDLTNGDLAAAASSNLLFVASLPVLVLCGRARCATGGGAGCGRSPPAGTGLAVAFLMVALVFAVVRNLPFGAWLAP